METLWSRGQRVGAASESEPSEPPQTNRAPPAAHRASVSSRGPDASTRKPPISPRCLSKTLTHPGPRRNCVLPPHSDPRQVIPLTPLHLPHPPSSTLRNQTCMFHKHTHDKTHVCTLAASSSPVTGFIVFCFFYCLCVASPGCTLLSLFIFIYLLLPRFVSSHFARLCPLICLILTPCLCFCRLAVVSIVSVSLPSNAAAFTKKTATLLQLPRGFAAGSGDRSGT